MVGRFLTKIDGVKPIEELVIVFLMRPPKRRIKTSFFGVGYVRFQSTRRGIVS
jgi:hypothetical protein